MIFRNVIKFRTSIKIPLSLSYVRLLQNWFYDSTKIFGCKLKSEEDWKKSGIKTTAISRSFIDFDLNLQQCNTCCLTGINGFLIPDGGLYFTDVGFAQQQHAQTGLTDTAADGAGQFAFQQHFVICQGRVCRHSQLLSAVCPEMQRLRGYP